jgi:hypothetical protein
MDRFNDRRGKHQKKRKIAQLCQDCGDPDADGMDRFFFTKMFAAIASSQTRGQVP